MNAFYEHHKNNIRFQYRCFDRMLLNGTIQPFQEVKRVLGFFYKYRHIDPVSRDVLRDIATQFHNGVQNQSQKWNVPIIGDPETRREELMDSYFKSAKDDHVVCILKAREPSRIYTATGNKKENRWHLELKRRWVDQYNFYLNDADWGRMFVRICPYFPFPIRICLNQHHWLAQRMRREDIRFRQSDNAFSQCSDPVALQRFADSLTADDIQRCGDKWLQQLIPFFTEPERRSAAVQHRLFFSQVEYCDNLIFSRRASLDRMAERLLDANRTIGQPNKVAIIFGRKITKRYKGKLETIIEDRDLPSPVIRSYYHNNSAKQYVRDRTNLRTEATTNRTYDYGINKGIDNLPQLREKQSTIIDRYLDVQQDILVSFIDRGQFHKLTQTTVLSNGKRIPGLKLDQPRLISLMHGLVLFSHIAAGDSFSTKEIHADTAEALDRTTDDYTLASLRYDLSKLRAKGLIEKIGKSRRYRLTPAGYRICVVYLKLFEKIYAPLTSGILKWVTADRYLADERTTPLDRLYRKVVRDLDQLFKAVNLKSA